MALDPQNAREPLTSLVLWARYLVASDSGVPLVLATLSTGPDLQIPVCLWSELVYSPGFCVPVTSDLCLQIETALLNLRAALLTLGQGWLSTNEYVPAFTVSWPCLHIRMTDNSV